MRDLAPALVSGIIGSVLLGVLMLAPRAGQPVLVVFPPGTAAQAAIAGVLAGGLRPIASPRSFVILAAPDGPGGTITTPAGAWIVLDAAGAKGCR